MTAKKYVASFGDNKNVLKLILIIDALSQYAKSQQIVSCI